MIVLLNNYALRLCVGEPEQCRRYSDQATAWMTKESLL